MVGHRDFALLFLFQNLEYETGTTTDAAERMKDFSKAIGGRNLVSKENLNLFIEKKKEKLFLV